MVLNSQQMKRVELYEVMAFAYKPLWQYRVDISNYVILILLRAVKYWK